MSKLREVRATVTLEIDVSVMSSESLEFLKSWEGSMEIEDLINYYVNYELFRDTERVVDYNVTSIEEVDNPNL